MGEWTQGDVLTNGIRMHYYRTGDGSLPPLVLCHGATDSGLCWTPVARALEGEYDIIMIDARNHGLSESPQGPSAPQEQSEDLAGLIRALGLERPTVMGHSMGGGATLQLAANHPDLVGRVILEDAAPVEFNPARLAPENRARMFDWMRNLKGKTREEVMAMGRQQSPTWSEEELGPWADSKLQVNVDAMSRYTPVSEPWRDLFARVRCPMLLIIADNDKGSMARPELAAEAARLFPNVRVAHVPGAGHNVRRENYDGFMAAVRAFLAEG
jgi:pimeloyl-ACP methyl ester carboxylesterase